MHLIKIKTKIILIISKKEKINQNCSSCQKSLLNNNNNKIKSKVKPNHSPLLCRTKKLITKTNSKNRKNKSLNLRNKIPH